jgi:8-oxo-dGTP diphosphatase
MRVELVILTLAQNQLRLLVGPNGLPSCPAKPGRPLDQAARRLLAAEVRAGHAYVEQLYSFGFKPSFVTAYLALVQAARALRPGRAWLPVRDGRRLAAEQRAVAACALSRLRNKITYSNLAFALLPDRFTLSELQQTYEVVLGRPLDKRNFRKKILSLRLLAPDGQARRLGRPARLYRFTGPRQVVFWPAFGSSFSGQRPAAS